MIGTHSDWFGRAAAAAVALVVVLSVVGSVGTVGAQSIASTQTTAATTTVAPGDTVQVETTVPVADLNAPAVDVTLPSGWTITTQSATPATATYFGAEQQWLWSGAADTDGVSGDYTVTYTVQVPSTATAGQYTIDAEGSGIVPASGDRLTSSDSVTITVEPEQTNEAPTADAGSDQTVDEGQPVSLDASGSTDPNGDSLSYSWTVLDDAGTGVSLTDAATATPSFTAPEVSADQTLIFEVTVDDGNGNTDTDTVAVTVGNVQTLNPGVSTSQTPSSTTVAPEDTVQLSATVSVTDVNAPAVDIDLPNGWSVVSQSTAPETATYAGSETQWLWSGAADADGVSGDYTVTYTVQVPSTATAAQYTIAAEGSGVDPATNDRLTSSDQSTITVEPEPTNQPPMADAGSDQTVDEGIEVQLDASGSSDPDGDTLDYSWTVLDDAGTGVSLTDAATATPSFTAPEVSADQTLTFEVTVDDGNGGSDSATVAVTVQNVPEPDQPPTASFDATPAAPNVGQPVTLDAAGSTDPDGSIESYEWTIDGADSGGRSATVLLDSDFESGSLSTAGWTHDAIESGAEAGVNSATAGSGSYAAYLQSGEGAIVSGSLDTSGADTVVVDYWVQKGASSFSDPPEGVEGEDIVVEYQSANGDWVQVDQVSASIADGATVDGSVTLTDAEALHDGFQLRFRQVAADYIDTWHVDDVTVTAQGDGSGTTTLTGETPSYSFPSAGDYDVTLTVTDDDGLTDTTTQTITVTQTDQSVSVPAAVASLNDDGDDSLVDTQEIQQAVDLWVEDEPVPGTDGDTISTQQLQRLVDLWTEDEPVDAGTGGGN